MNFTESEDDSVTSDLEMSANEIRLAKVFWKTRTWIVQ